MKTLKYGALLFILIQGCAWGSNYKWVDEQGHTQYGQTPPNGVAFEEVKASKASSSQKAEISAFESQQAKEEEEKSKAEEALKTAEQESAEKRVWQANCTAAKVKLKSLQEKPKVRKVDAYGNLSLIPENDLQNKIDQSQKEVALYCKDDKSVVE